MFLKRTPFRIIRIIIFHDSGESVDEVQDDETSIQHLVPCTMLVDTTVENKKSSQLLTVILYIERTTTMINLKVLPKYFVPKVLSKPLQ